MPFLIVVLSLAVLFDFKTGKVPNGLIFLGLAGGMLRLIFLSDWGTVFLQLQAVFLPLLLLFPLFRIGVLGAGDIKLFSVIGCFFSLQEELYLIFLSFTAGAILGVFFLWKNRNFRERMYYLFSYLKSILVTGHFELYDSDVGVKASNYKIHFTLPIFIGVLLHAGGVCL